MGLNARSKIVTSSSVGTSSGGDTVTWEEKIDGSGGRAPLALAAMRLMRNRGPRGNCMVKSSET
jgi:hypothetical protein